MRKGAESGIWLKMDHGAAGIGVIPAKTKNTVSQFGRRRMGLYGSPAWKMDKSGVEKKERGLAFLLTGIYPKILTADSHFPIGFRRWRGTMQGGDETRIDEMFMRRPLLRLLCAAVA